MTKKELEQKLNEIHVRLQELGDLRENLEESKRILNNTNSIFDQINQKKNEIELFSNQIPSKQELIKDTEDTINSFDEKISNLISESEELKEKYEKSVKESKEIEEITRQQLGYVSSEKLANSFFKEAEDLKVEEDKWFKWLIASLIALVFVLSLVVIWQIEERGVLFEWGFLIRFPLITPFIYFSIFINKQYSRSRNLVEEYSFKAAVARSFEAYREIIESLFEGRENEDIIEKKISFIISAIKNIYSSPMKNIKNNYSKNKDEINIPLLNNIVGVFRKIGDK